tara:strand:+ start:2235 stop:3434 length:1200 start_codon:yes stop_codon:yes gene_type:complete
MVIPTRRFGRTGYNIPLLSLGGMRFQKSWNELDIKEIAEDDQRIIEKILYSAVDIGMNHIETARHYGSSEKQLSLAIRKVKDPNRIIQTKIPPTENPKDFNRELEMSFEALDVSKIDLIAIHGINTEKQLEQTLRPGGCLEVAREWKDKGLIKSIGFSTHAPSRLIEKSISSNQFDFVNLHWYFINQANINSLALAKKYDMGVFIISPTDKGGHLHTPSGKLLELCKPIHPIIFNDLFCLRNKFIHTISVGAAKSEDLSLHLQAIAMIKDAENILPPVENKLIKAAQEELGETWLETCQNGLPSWKDTPGNINIPVLVWLYNLLKAWHMDSFVKSRYQLLGNGGHWFPGENSNEIDISVNEFQLLNVMPNSQWGPEIIEILRHLKKEFGDSEIQSLTNL